MQSEHGAGLDAKESVIVTVNKLRKIVRFYIDTNCNESALFWADKAATISNDCPRDVYWLAQCMFRCGEYNRAVFLIKKKGLDKTQPLFQWFAGLCLFEAKKYHDALLVLTGESEQAVANNSVSVASSACFLSTSPITMNHILEGFTPESLRSALLALKGRIYEKLDRRSCALECFKQSLKYDVYCYDSFQSLVQHQMLTAAEEKELLITLPFKSQCFNNDLLPSVYEELLNKYQQLSPPHKQPSGILGNLDLQAARAERLFYACHYDQCYKLTEEILKADPFHKRTLPLHISCLVDLKKSNGLFYLAHELVDLSPERAASWYAVGCYYLLTANQSKARRYFSKAICMDRYFGPAWLAYGHSFAEENEHDQAMAAYLSAAKLMKGCHFPLLYVGAECGLINNLKLAERFLTQAQSIAPNDPFIFHEMGTIAYQNEDYSMAEEHFLKALEKVQKYNNQIISEKWEPLLNNLGHTFRKQRRFTEALSYHRHALSVLPQNPTTLTNIGFVQALQGNFVDAIDTFHKVLGLKQDDIFSLTMLSYLIEQLVYITPTFHDLRGSEE